MLARGHFQDVITPPSQTDIVVLILWSRMGTHLPERTEARKYEGLDGRAPVTGTEWEFEDAKAAALSGGAPDLLVYRKTVERLIPIRETKERAEAEAQWTALQEFWCRHFEDRGQYKSAFSTFDSLKTFEEKLEAHLRNLIEATIARQDSAVEGRHAVSWFDNPFRGLAAYRFEDAPIFFGRGRAITKCVEQLVERQAAGCGFLLIVGPSGAGKSSLAQAGIASAIVAHGVVPGAGMWRRAVMRPAGGSSCPFENLATALLENEALPELASQSLGLEALAEHLHMAAAHPSAPIKMMLARLTEAALRDGDIHQHENVRLLLIVDQLEELFTMASLSREDHGTFIRVLQGLASCGVVYIVATLRSDHWHRAAEVPTLIELANGEGRMDLSHPSGPELAEMIRRPAEAAGLHFEKRPDTEIGLDAELVAEADKADGSLPLLSYLLDALYQKDIKTRGGVQLSYRGVEELGGFRGAIAARAEAALEKLPDDTRNCLGATLRSLVTISNIDGEPVALTAPLDSFIPGSQRRVLIEALAHPSVRLLVLAGGKDCGATVRVAHEALLTSWKRAADFVRQNRKDLETRTRLAEAERLWSQAAPGNRNARLLSGLALAEAVDLVQRWQEDVGENLREFVRESRSRAARIRRFGFALTLLVIALLGSATVVSLFSRQAAVQSRETALQAEQEARLTLTKLFAERAFALSDEGKQDLAARFALAGYRLSSANEEHYRTALATILQRAGQNDLIPARRGVQTFSSSDGSLHAYVEEEIEVRIERTNDRSFQGAFMLPSPVVQIVFSTDGEFVFVLDKERNATLRRLNGTVVWRHVSTSREFGWGAFSPDARFFLYSASRSLSSDTSTTKYVPPRVGIVKLETLQDRLLNLENGLSFAGPEFSADGMCALTEISGTLRGDEIEANLYEVFSLSTRERLLQVQKPISRGLAQLSANCSYLIVGDGEIEIWDVATGQILAALPDRGLAVRLATTADEKSLFVAYSGGTIRRWDLESGTEVMSFSVPSDLSELAVSADGKLVAANFLDGYLRIWDGESTRFHGAVFVEEFGGDHPQFLDANTVFIHSKFGGKTWRYPEHKLWQLFKPSESGVKYTVEVSMDDHGTRIVTRPQSESTAYLTEVDTDMVFSLPSLDGLGSRKVLSRDGDSIFSVSTPGRLRRGQSFVSRIDAKSREEVARVEFDSRLYRELGVSADGRWVAVTAEDEAPFILHSDDLTLKCRLTPPESTDDRRFGGAVGFSSDSRRVAISMNYSTEVWNVEACVREARLNHRQPSPSPGSPRFFDGDSKLVTAGRFRPISIWNWRAEAKLRDMQDSMWIYEVAVSNDGSRIFGMGLIPQKSGVWDGNTGQRLLGLLGTGEVALTVDNKHAAVGYLDGSILLHDIRRLTSPISELIDIACHELLGEVGARFTQLDIDSESLLQSEWQSPERSVCETTRQAHSDSD